MSSDRLPTVKLTRPEWINLINTLAGAVGENELRAAFARAIGEDAVREYTENHDGPPPDKKPTWAIIRELYGIVPGSDRAEKIASLIAILQPAFESPERFSEVVAYARARVEEFEASGGSVDHFPEPPPPEDPPSDDIDLSAARWHGPNGGRAAVTESLENLKIDSHKISYTLSKGTEGWQPHNAAQKNCNQYACFFVLRDGLFQGGKFDWSTYSRKTRELKNIRGGYTGGIVPNSGETVWFCFMDLNGKNRTNCQAVQWP